MSRQEPPHRSPDDRPLRRHDPFNVAAHVFLAPRRNPAGPARPPANGEIDPRAVARVARMMRNVVG